MRLTIRILGTEVLHITTEPDPTETGPGDCTTYPVGFVSRMPVPQDVELPDRE